MSGNVSPITITYSGDSSPYEYDSAGVTIRVGEWADMPEFPESARTYDPGTPPLYSSDDNYSHGFPQTMTSDDPGTPPLYSSDDNYSHGFPETMTSDDMAKMQQFMTLRLGEQIVTTSGKSFWSGDYEVTQLEGAATGDTWAQALRNGGKIVTTYEQSWFSKSERKITKVEPNGGCVIL